MTHSKSKQVKTSKQRLVQSDFRTQPGYFIKTQIKIKDNSLQKQDKYK